MERLRAAETVTASSGYVNPLERALREIIAVLGSGTCSANKCEGCGAEMYEAAEIARKALAS